ncbi:ATP-dependent helicase/nuclease subunit B [Hydrogenophaga palleronii]|uniref:ATP-dependent helicase/nuclease subunit B n=1 Tax=Hydrogenophaga palleronii TaxID=65655 RepID=A0ABU1WIP4_9BURK|nr:PD-(D/E)XK nuclease family protein [Hydrogenophaga palleronii]MDR7148921.1 ATP-dependent helicase/nuclease subunit B [Hydrogenophaga palleronii]
MNPAGQSDDSGLPMASSTEGAAPAKLDPQWSRLAEAIHRLTAQHGVKPGRVLVLVPYAQLMEEGRRAWGLLHPGGFPPRFESSRNLATSLQPFFPGATDLSMDMARDSLVAASFVERVAKARTDPAIRALMVSRLIEAATQLAPAAAAIAPEQRLAWANSLQEQLRLRPTALHWESLLGSLALTWAGTSSFATDALWGPAAQPGILADAMLVVPGFHDDPLAKALVRHWGERATVLPLIDQADDPHLGQHAHMLRCADSEDEAQQAAACVLTRVNSGLAPVALVANDRILVRRISAMLTGAGVAVRDETGWRLSTTHAASQVMALLRAAGPNARTDDVLDWMKLAPAWNDAQIQRLERAAREAGASRWRAVLKTPALADVVPADLPPLLVALQPPRTLSQWLTDTSTALMGCGMWDPLQLDEAGQQLIRALRLGRAGAEELLAVSQALTQTANVEDSQKKQGSGTGGRMSLSALGDWVQNVLEGASFTARHGADPLVVVLPMAQLLGRGFKAAVVPGCDEVHLPTSPEPPGQWTAEQRMVLGLPSRAALAEAAAGAWQATLATPQLDILWRSQERGESMLASAWVQALPAFSRIAVAGATGDHGTDRRPMRSLVAQVAPRPTPSASDLLPERLSASAYQDLRHCPYRFFALRQLRLTETPELDEAPDQRDMGNWLHAVLRAFHEQRGDARPGEQADRLRLDQLAVETADAMGLNADESAAGFLPFEAMWPALREGYLAWLAGYESRESGAGPRFEMAEVAREVPLGPWKLYGKLDRVDVQGSPEGPIPLVIDYKTESRARTLDRVKEPLEDTQLAFYAALLPQDNLRAAYLSITDKRGDGPKEASTLWVEQEDVLMAREELRKGLVHDMSRVAGGQAMPALGEGQACDYCAARGLCRKDFWGQQ